MIGIDTNVLVRFLMRDDPIQSEIASRFLHEHCTSDAPGYINHIVLCELVWVLRRYYKISRQDVVRMINDILWTDDLEVEAPDTVWHALRDCEMGLGDFPDCLLARVNRERGCSITVTLDVEASRAPGMRLLT